MGKLAKGELRRRKGRANRAGGVRRTHDQRQAERWIAEGLGADELAGLPGSNLRKVALARLVWRKTTVSQQWIADRLQMSARVRTGGHSDDGPTPARMRARGAGRDDDAARLSDRELAIYEAAGAGHGPTRIARDLRISVKTVETHHRRIREKLEVGSTEALRERARRWLAAGRQRA